MGQLQEESKVGEREYDNYVTINKQRSSGSLSHWLFRFKGFNFAEAGLGFELPKQLAVSDVAVRLLHTHYDLLSLLARVAHVGTSTSPGYCLHFKKLNEHSVALICAICLAHAL